MKPRFALAFGVIVTSALAANVPVEITPQKVVEDYQTFTKVTKEPKPIGQQLFFACAGSPLIEQILKETGPHAGRYVNYYLNEAAHRVFAGQAVGGYPPGSVIVKEKFVPGGRARDGALKIVALAGMIKLKPGLNPNAVDWEFFCFYPEAGAPGPKQTYWAKANEMRSCVSCHSNAPDMVFGRFNEPYKTPKLVGNGKAIQLEVAPTDGLQLGPKK